MGLFENREAHNFMVYHHVSRQHDFLMRYIIYNIYTIFLDELICRDSFQIIL